jgi:hypothetical protein
MRHQVSDTFPSTGLLRLAEAGQDQEAVRLIELAKGIQCAESKVRRHAKDAGVGRIVKLSEH